MSTTTVQPIWTHGSGARRGAMRLWLVCAAVLALVALLATGPAMARIETSTDTGSHAAPSDASAVAAPARVTRTRVAGLYGVKVQGGWLLR
jgi:hypothetical protein